MVPFVQSASPAYVVTPPDADLCWCVFQPAEGPGYLFPLPDATGAERLDEFHQVSASEPGVPAFSTIVSEVGVSLCSMFACVKCWALECVFEPCSSVWWED